MGFQVGLPSDGAANMIWLWVLGIVAAGLVGLLAARPPGSIVAFRHQRSAIHTLTIAKSGTGKTYYRGVRFLLEEWLPNHSGDFWSNLPLRPRRIAREHEKRTGADRVATRQRIKSIPKAVLDLWYDGSSGPWEFFSDVDLSGARIVLDEVHSLIGDHTPAKARKQWQAWLAELRHSGATIEGISQTESQIAPEFKKQCALRYDLRDNAADTIPYLRVCIGDWLELQAAYLRVFLRRTLVIEAAQEGSSFVEKWRSTFILQPYFFKFYNSFSAGKNGNAGQEEKHEFERRSFLGVHLWFLARNWHMLAVFLAGVLALGWIFNGGLATTFNGVFRVCSAAFQSSLQPKESASEAPAVEPEAAPVHPLEVKLDFQLAEVERQTMRLLADNERLRDRLRSENEFGGLLSDAVWLRDGSIVRIGQAIPGGTHRGRRVVGVDVPQRQVRLDNGAVVRLPFSWLPRTTDSPGAPESDVSRSVPGTSGRSLEASGPGDLAPSSGGDRQSTPGRAGLSNVPN